MAARPEGSLKLHLTHGAKNHFVTLTPSAQDEEGELAICNLTAMVHELTGIPPERQKLIFRGKSLTTCADPSQSLYSLGLREGSKVMVLGSKEDLVSRNVSDCAQNKNTDNARPQSQTEDPIQTDIHRLEGVEKRLGEEETILSALLEKGQQLIGDNWCEPGQLEQLMKGLMSAEEKLMRLLESLDTLMFEPSDNDARTRRKSLVNKIQKHMDTCEEMISRIKMALVAAGRK